MSAHTRKRRFPSPPSVCKPGTESTDIPWTSQPLEPGGINFWWLLSHAGCGVFVVRAQTKYLWAPSPYGVLLAWVLGITVQKSGEEGV